MHHLPWSAKAWSSRGTIYRLLLSKSSLDLQELLGRNWQVSYVPAKLSTGGNFIKLLSTLNGNKNYLLSFTVAWLCNRYITYNVSLLQVLTIFTNVCKAILVYRSDWYQALLIKTDYATIAWQDKKLQVNL